MHQMHGEIGLAKAEGQEELITVERPTATYALKRKRGHGEREVMGNNNTWRTTKLLNSANHFKSKMKVAKGSRCHVGQFQPHIFICW